MRRMAAFVRVAAMLAALAAVAGPPGVARSDEQRANKLFGAEKLPAVAAAQSFGFYSKGCFAGGVAIAEEGPTWEVMRPSRNRRWGHPTMIRLIEKLSRDAVADGWPGLLIGDISQPRGGPMLDGHASHQIGLDADIWLNPMPDHRMSVQERDTRPAVSLIRKGTFKVDDKLWTTAHMRLLKRAASYPEVERIFVHPGIKKKLCDTVKGDRSWLNKIRPNWGHDYHFHVRIACQPGSPGCKPQKETGNDDGCGEPLAWWFNVGLKQVLPGPEVERPRDVMTLKDLPRQCRAVLDAPGPASAEAATMGIDGTMIASVPAAPPSAVAVAPPATEPAAGSGGTDVAALPVSAYAETPDIGVPLPKPRPDE